MKRFNAREFARQITLLEGGKVNLSIAQVAEVVRLTLTELAKFDRVEYDAIIQRYRNRPGDNLAVSLKKLEDKK